MGFDKFNSDDEDDEPFNEMTSNAKVGRKSITAVLDEDDDAEILGFAMMSTTGDWIYAPREELMEKFEQYGIHPGLMPRKVQPWMAYSRMTNELVHSDNDEETVRLDTFDRDLQVTFRLEDGEGKYYHLYGDVYYPEEVIGEEGGKHNAVHVLTLNYLPESEKLLTPPQIDKDHALWDYCAAFMSRAQTLFAKHQENHNGSDLRGVINDFLFQGANTVRFRNGCYFVGAHHQETVEGMSEVWSWLNRHKERGQRAEIMTIPVVDSEKQRQQVERLAREKTEEMVDEAIGEALEDLTGEENVEELAEAMVREVSQAESFVSEYNALLDAEISVEKVLEERREELEDEKEEIVSSVLERLE